MCVPSRTGMCQPSVSGSPGNWQTGGFKFILNIRLESGKCANQMSFVHKETKDQRQRSSLIHRFYRRCVNY